MGICTKAKVSLSTISDMIGLSYYRYFLCPSDIEFTTSCLKRRKSIDAITLLITKWPSLI